MISQNIPVLDGNERRYVLECLDTNWISSLGKYIPAFEETFAAFCRRGHGVACSSGTAALHLALEALEIGFGDEVIVPCFTLVADANMVILAGARPVFVDVDPQTYCLDPALIEAKITPRTKAILVVHMYGHPCDMDVINALAQRHGLKVIEDAAQAHGSLYRGRPAGSLGDIACFSFYASKTLTTGEGGMVLTDDPALAQRLRALRSQGFEGDSRLYVHNLLGFNYRLTNLQAAIGLAQVERMDFKVERKRHMAELYSQCLTGLEGLTLPPEMPWAFSTYWNYTVLIGPAFGLERDEVAQRLKQAGVETRLTFKPLHSQPAYRRADPRMPDTTGHFPVSQRLGREGLCLPSGTGLTDDEIKQVSQTLAACRQG